MSNPKSEMMRQGLKDALECGHLQQLEGNVRWMCDFTRPVEESVLSRNIAHKVHHIQQVFEQAAKTEANESLHEYSPKTFGETKNTLGSFRPANLTHPMLNSDQIAEFHAERLLEAGYVVVYDEDRAKALLAGRKS